MNNLDKYKSLLGDAVDGLLLTSRYSRHYAAEFDIAEGVALVSRKGCRYFTDSRYIESAERDLRGFEVLPVDREHSYAARINEACEAFGVRTLGFEEGYLTVAEFQDYKAKLTAELKPCQAAIHGFRAQKEPWELRLMEQAQEITDKAFSEILTRIRVGMTEKELCAELIYCLYKNGADGLSFDPIVVSGPNTSMPHGVPGDRALQEGDFITMDFGVLYQGYCSDMTRTVALGYVTEEMERVYQTVLAAQKARHCRLQGRRARQRGGRRRQKGDCGRRIRGLFRPRLRPQPGPGDSRGPQLQPVRHGAHAGGRGMLCRAGHLPSRSVRCPD